MVVNKYNLQIWENIKDYDKEVISIFENKQNNLLIEKINKIKNKNKKIVLDLGCGSGNSFEYLLNFKKIIAIDFSINMLKQAKAKAKKLNISEIKFLNLTLEQVSLDQPVKVIIAANSIFPSNYGEFDYIMASVKKNIKKNGTILMVLLSFESLTFFYQILAHNEFKTKQEINASFSLINKYILDSNYSPFGYINTTLGMQKHWLKEEIEFRLKIYNFKKIKIEKLELDWELQIKQPQLKEYPKLWFWIVEIKA